MGSSWATFCLSDTGISRSSGMLRLSQTICKLSRGALRGVGRIFWYIELDVTPLLTCGLVQGPTDIVVFSERLNGRPRSITGINGDSLRVRFCRELV